MGRGYTPLSLRREAELSAQGNLFPIVLLGGDFQLGHEPRFAFPANIVENRKWKIWQSGDQLGVGAEVAQESDFFSLVNLDLHGVPPMKRVERFAESSPHKLDSSKC